MSDIIFLSVNQVCAIQKSILSCAPSSNLGLIEGAVNRITNQHYYNGMSDIFELAALYLVAIAKAHAFPDANKRTAFEAMMIFLQMNNIFVVENEEIVEITVKAAEGSISIKEIVEVLKNVNSI